VAHAKERVLGVKELTGYFRALARDGPEIAEKLLRDGAEIILAAAKENIRATFENQTGALENSGKVVMVGRLAAVVEFDIVYSAVHEYGLDNQVITDLQRRFFWFKFIGTGDEMWKWLALSRTYTIPARPYLRPAIDTHKGKALHEMAGTLRHEMVKRRPKAFSGGPLRL